MQKVRDKDGTFEMLMPLLEAYRISAWDAIVQRMNQKRACCRVESMLDVVFTQTALTVVWAACALLWGGPQLLSNQRTNHNRTKNFTFIDFRSFLSVSLMFVNRCLLDFVLVRMGPSACEPSSSGAR